MSNVNFDCFLGNLHADARIYTDALKLVFTNYILTTDLIFHSDVCLGGRGRWTDESLENPHRFFPSGGFFSPFPSHP